ncbi:MAG: calcineurin-like phosphoesterase C-terminal domain-containing protein [Bacteroidales bacterium]|nr:calcineurin-like phosphoesterase C-terminal domain-containing protein [Bacteroidales bacterium]
MKKVIIVIAALLAFMPLEAKKVKGTVQGDGNPLSGVIVSDGYRFTKTKADGSFVINTHKDARCVFVITPSGYVGDFSTGVPQFYLPIKGTKDFTFKLQKYGEGEDYTLFSISDPQMANNKHLKRFKGRPLGDLRGMARKCSGERTTVAVTLGDQGWNKLDIFDGYKAAVATTGIPFYAVIGNHDHIQNRSGIAAGAAYEAAFGPYNYAFFLGGDLVICVNNLIFKASGLEDPEKSSNKYVEGYPKETLDFVRGLLAFVGKDTHIFMAQHSPIRYTFERKTKDIEGSAEMLSILEGYRVDILSGHTHDLNITPVNQWVTDHNAAAIGGAWWSTDWCRDGTPRGYEIITSVNGKRTWNWHNIDYPDDFQVQFIDMDKAPRHRNSVLANAWYADDTWTADWYQDGTYMGPAEKVYDISPSYTQEILAAFDGDASKVPGYKRPESMRHYYAATPSQYASKVTMVVKAPDGRSWSHDFDLREYIDLQAHRGGAGLMPENTISSMKNAIDLYVNTLEMDLQLSADGKVVVSHDNYFHPRYSMRPDSSLVQKEDPKEYLYTMPYDSIARYDVGLRPVDRWPEQKKVSEHKPLVSDLIDFTEEYSRSKGLTGVRYNIEIKSRAGKGEGKNWPEYKEFCDKCLAVLLSKNLGDRLVVQTFDVRALEYIHEKYPQVELSYLTDEKETDIEKILSQVSFLPRWWSPNYQVVTRHNVAYCHALGIKVVPWTVDAPNDIQRMVDCGVDAIISNYPDRLIEIVR